jgi:hypothetical protein
MPEYHGIWRNITEYHDIFPEYTGTSQYFPIVANATVYKHERLTTYFSPCSVSFVLSGEYIQYSPLINFRLTIPSNIHLQLIIPSNIHLQCLCSTKNEKKQHHEGNLALRITSILNH